MVLSSCGFDGEFHTPFWLFWFSFIGFIELRRRVVWSTSLPFFGKKNETDACLELGYFGRLGHVMPQTFAVTAHTLQSQRFAPTFIDIHIAKFSLPRCFPFSRLLSIIILATS